MALVNHEKREVVIKVVYCGPAGSGKTANLKWIHSTMDPSQRSEFEVSAAAADYTAHFDLYPDAVAVRDGYRTRFQIYTAPGMVSYNATRQMVMKGADGLVFVADSEPVAMEDNWRAFQLMIENLGQGGAVLGSVPLVLQYNKRDAIDAVSVGYLESVFNRPEHRLPSFEAVANSGYNVMVTLNAVAQLVLHRFREVIGESNGSGAPLHGGGPEAAAVEGSGDAIPADADGWEVNWDHSGSREVLAGTSP